MTARMFAAAALAMLASPALAEEPRTFVEALDLSSPEAAMQTFIDAYRRSDYLTVYYVLSPDAQLGFRHIMGSMMGYDVVFPEVEGFDLPGAVMTDQSASEDLQRVILADAALAFDNILFAADQAGKLAFTFGPNAEMLNQDERSNGDVLIEVSTGGEPAEITLRLHYYDIGAWKVEQLTWDGSWLEAVPWGVEPKE